MKKIIAIFDVPGMTEQHYNDIVNQLKEMGKYPNEDRPSHVAFQKGDNWCVIDVWNSKEALMQFGTETLFGLFAKAGINPPEPQIYPVHHFIGGAVEEYMNY